MVYSRKKHTRHKKNRVRGRGRGHSHGHRTVRRGNTNKDNLQRNNFYLWANQKWLKEVPKTLPKELRYIRPLDNFKLIQDEMYKNVITMYHDYVKEHSKSAGSSGSGGVAHQMKNIYTSFLNLNPL